MLLRDSGPVSADRVERAVGLLGSPQADATATEELRREIRDSMAAVNQGQRWAQVFWWPGGLAHDLSPPEPLGSGASAPAEAETSVILIPLASECLEMRVVWPMREVHYRVRKHATGLIHQAALGRLTDVTSALLALAPGRPELKRVERKVGDSVEISLSGNDFVGTSARWLVRLRPRPGKESLVEYESAWIGDRLINQWQMEYAAGDDLPTSATEISAEAQGTVRTFVRVPDFQWTGVSLLPYLREAGFDVVRVGEKLREAGFSFAVLEESERSREAVLRLGLPL
jgi:hypothetical protein